MRSPRHSNAHDEEPGHERWLVSYADFITLMFAFFAVLYATSQKDVEKSKQFQESIKKFLIGAGAGTGATAGASANPATTTVGNTPIETPIETYRPSSKPESAKVEDQADTFIESRLTSSERKDYVLDVATDDLGLRISLRGAAIYDEGSEKFRANAMPFLGKLSQLLAETKRKVLIEGHVNSGEMGSYKSTWDFASARAVNLLRFVQKKEGLASDQLAVATLADSRPIYKGEKAQQNSRLEIVLLNSDQDL